VISQISLVQTAILGSIDVTPHYITQRYADLASSLMKLQGGGESASSSASLGIGGGGDSMLMGDLQQLRVEMVALLEKLALFLPGPKEQKVFLVNNYDLIVSVFQEKRLHANEEVQKFEDMLMQQRELFAEEAVKISFPKLIAFVIQTEERMANEVSSAGVKSRVILDEVIVESLVRDFSANWKVGIQQINDDVLAYFANFRNGMEILKQVVLILIENT
jgi:hypothetical protein